MDRAGRNDVERKKQTDGRTCTSRMAYDVQKKQTKGYITGGGGDQKCERVTPERRVSLADD